MYPTLFCNQHSYQLAPVLVSYNGCPKLCCPLSHVQPIQVPMLNNLSTIEFKLFIYSQEGKESEIIQKIANSPLLQNSTPQNSGNYQTSIGLYCPANAKFRQEYVPDFSTDKRIWLRCDYSSEHNGEAKDSKLINGDKIKVNSKVEHQSIHLDNPPSNRPSIDSNELEGNTSARFEISRSTQSTGESQILQQHLLAKTNNTLGLVSPWNDNNNFNLFDGQIVPLRNLKSIYFFLQRFFRCKRITVDDVACLSGHELDILNLIIQRKYETALFRSEAEKNDLNGIFDVLEKCQHNLPAKRAEESFKFIFTRAFKHLKKSFNTRNQAVKSECGQVDSFFEYYFGDSSPTFKFIMERLGHPQQHKISKVKYSNLNLMHFKALINCTQFMEDMNKYLDQEVFYDHELEIDRKTLQLLGKWDSKFTGLKEKDDKAALKIVKAEIARYFLHNKRCKLPWTLAEVSNSVQRIHAIKEKATNLERYRDTA